MRSADEFRRRWLQGYATLIQDLPGITGYRQNVIVERERVKGTPFAYEKLPIDGIAELWFDDAPSMEQAFSSRSGREAMTRAKTVLAEITAFLVREYRVV